MLSNFPLKKTYNPGGYSRFRFVEHQMVVLFPMITGGVAQVELGLRPGATWYDGYATHESLRFTESAVQDNQGTYYNQAISGFIPGDKSELTDLIQKMENQRLLITIQDSLGIIRLVGTIGSPMIFAGSFDSGERRADRKGYSFSISGKSLFRAPEYPF